MRRGSVAHGSGKAIASEVWVLMAREHSAVKGLDESSSCISKLQVDVEETSVHRNFRSQSVSGRSFRRTSIGRGLRYREAATREQTCLSSKAVAAAVQESPRERGLGRRPVKTMCVQTDSSCEIG